MAVHRYSMPLVQSRSKRPSESHTTPLHLAASSLMGKRVLHVWRSFEVATLCVHEFVQRFMRELSIWLAGGKIKVWKCLFVVQTRFE